ncbi:MAG: AsmA family protein [Gammaproteobacteria bacterium]|nr:AsmA family protein [Gammaproteobacteria bacterium]
MNGALGIRRTLTWSAATLTLLIAAVAIFAVAIDAGYFREPLLRYVAVLAERRIEVGGALDLHVLSFHPKLVAERVSIGNPPWVRPGMTADIGKLTLAIELPWFGRPLSIHNLQIEAATLHLLRDSAGYANWQWTDPDTGTGTNLLIHSLSMRTAHVELDDARRHVHFTGTVSIHEVGGAAAPPPLRIEGSGQLNGRPAIFGVSSDPLATASRTKPYRFAFDERSSGSRLTGSGSLLQPFDFDVIDTTFEASGADLKDLYFLAGVTLVNTGSYHLSGTLARRGSRSTFSRLVATSGASDMHGTVSIESSSGRPQIEADLNSQLLRLADLGARAAGRDSEVSGPPLLLSDAMFNPAATRRGDGLVNFHARRVEVGRVPLLTVAAKMTIDRGIVVVAPVSARVLDGKLTAHVRVDATTDDPAAEVDLQIGALQLGQLVQKASTQPPIDGSTRARVAIKGHGRSLHQVAASANGTVTAVLSRGTIRTSLAELTGLDLRGLGLLLTKSEQETGVRCGVASFRAHDGTLEAQNLVIDTEPVLITGDGNIHLDSEALDLTLRGRPKGLRLARLRAPVVVHGTLLHPSIGIKAANVAAQTAAAVALGVALTPLASILAFVDPGLAKDADCAALVATAKAPGSQVPAPARHSSP